MKLLKNIVLWILVGFFAIMALGTIPSFACCAAVVVALLIAPVKKWQDFLSKYVKGKIKNIVATVLAVLMFGTLPVTDVSDNETIPTENTILSVEETTETVVETVDEMIIETTTEVMTEPVAESIPEPTQIPATEPVLEPTQIPATEPAPEPTQIPVTEPVPEPTQISTTEPTPEPETEPTSTPATTPTTEPSTNSSGGSVADGDPDNDDSNGQTVYRTPSGSRYHLDPQCGGDNSYAVTIEAAEKAGLTPCKKCAQ